jgi:hypothetical protein
MILTQTAGAIDLADPYHDVSLPVGEFGELVPVLSGFAPVGYRRDGE